MKQPSEAMQKDWSMREIKETRYQELLDKEQRLEAIESVDGGEVFNIFKISRSIEQTCNDSEYDESVSLTLTEYNQLKNYILKTQQQVKELEELKKPPTADELCRALSDLFDTEIVYNESKRWFRSVNGLPFIFPQQDGTLKILYDLTSTLHKMVGEFYEVEVNNE